MAESSFLSLCLKVPNLGTILFFLVFVFMIPTYLAQSGSTNMFIYYFPFLVMLAVSLTESGKPYMFQELYPIPSKTLNGFILFFLKIFLIYQIASTDLTSGK